MVFHVPITLREYNRWTVAVSETVMVTEAGPKTFIPTLEFCGSSSPLTASSSVVA